MIKLKFNIHELNEFYKYLVECVKSIKLNIELPFDFKYTRKLNAELSEFNTLLLKVQRTLTNAFVLQKIQKKYTISISYMQGYLITTDYELNNELGSYISAILAQHTSQINKQLM